MLQGGRSHPIVDFWLALVTVWLPVSVCWLAVSRDGFRHREIPLAAAAVTSYAAGNTYYVVTLGGAGSLPFPSLSDVGYLGFYPLMLAALFVIARKNAQGMASSVWLDCAVGWLGTAAVLTVLLSPVLDSAVSGAPSLATVVSLAYPLSDMLLVATVAAIVSLGPTRGGGSLVLVIVGLMTFAAGDVVYALRVTAETYVVGTPVDATWAIGLALVAVWVDKTSRRDRSKRAEPAKTATGPAALAVSTVATVAGLGVLVGGTRTHLSTLTVTLAGVTLLAAGARTQLSFRQLAWMADLRRKDATTDDLTGLPNRRALYAEGHARLVNPTSRRQALLMLDLDKFKEVNDSLGHHAGDQLLIQVASRLLDHLRAGDLLARLGGDEFAILLEDAGHDEATEVTAKLRAAVAAPFTVEGIALQAGVSAGIALFPDHGRDLSTLLRKADIAMYKAKTSGSGYHAYNIVGDDNDTPVVTASEQPSGPTSDQRVLRSQPLST